MKISCQKSIRIGWVPMLLVLTLSTIYDVRAQGVESVDFKQPIKALYIPLADHYAALVAYERYRDDMVYADFAIEQMKSWDLLRAYFQSGEIEFPSGNGSAPEGRAEIVFDDSAMHDRLMGDQALMRSVAETFLDDMKGQIESLKSAAAAGDAEQTTAQAHKIKGAAANVGGLAFSACALEMEDASKAGNMQMICQELPQLEQSFAQLKATMTEVLF